MAKINSTSYADKDMEQGNVLPLLMEVQICTATVEINIAVLQKTGNQSTARHRYMGIYPKDALS